MRRANSSNNKMELVTLEGLNSLRGPDDDLMDHCERADDWEPCKSRAKQKLAEIESQGIPHWSALRDQWVAMGVIADGNAHIFTDNNGNIIIFGFYECRDSDDNAGDNCKNPSPFRVMLDQNVLFKGAPLDLYRNSDGTLKTFPKWDPNQHLNYRERAVGDDNCPSKRDDAPWWFCDATSGIQDMVNAMREIERLGIKSPYPYIYFLKDVDPFTFKDAVRYAAPILGALLVIGAGIISGGTLSPLAAAAVSGLNEIVGKFVDTGVLTIGDVGQAAIHLAPTVFGDKDSLIKKGATAIGFEAKDVLKYVKTGNDLYAAVTTKDVGMLANTLGVNKITAKGVLKDLGISDTAAVSFKTGLPLMEIDKVMLSMQNSEMVKSLLQDYKEIEQLSNETKNALQFQPVQQFVINALANTEVAMGIPNAMTAAKVIINNHDLNINEFKGMVNLMQGQPASIDAFERLGLEAMKERAKSYVGRTFVMPSNIPAHLQGYYAKEIEKSIPGVNVVIPYNETTSKFYPEFI